MLPSYERAPASAIRTSRPEPLKSVAPAADPLHVSPAHDDPATAELASAYQEYRGAMTAWRAAGKAGDAGTAERAADRLLLARVELYRRLVATGWSPPHAVEVQLDRDAALVAAPADFDALLAG